MDYRTEKNKAVLEESLKRLPNYFPAPSNWEIIEQALEQDQLIQERIPSLPRYEAPTIIWEAIESTIHPPKRLWIRRSWKYAAAASIVLLMSIWGLSALLIPRTGVHVSYAYGQELQSSSVQIANWSDDEAAFSEVLALYEGNELLKQSTAYQDAITELEELNAAREELKLISQQYNNTDAGMIRRLKSIENQRTEVVRSLVAYASF